MADMDFDQTIGIAPQFSSYALDERQVLLLSEQRSFRLTGKLYVALLPFLDGSRTGQAVVEAFEGRFDGARLRGLGGGLAVGHRHHADRCARELCLGLGRDEPKLDP